MARAYAPVRTRALILPHLSGTTALEPVDVVVPRDGFAGGFLQAGRLHGVFARVSQTKFKPGLV